MPAVPLPGQVSIQRADWGSPVQDAMGQAANAIGQIANPIAQANDIQGQLAKQNSLTAQTGNDINDLQQKQRAQQISMLSGVLNEPDPDKQRALLDKLIPVANRINPSYQIDPSVGVPEIRAMVQSQVSPEKQAELQYQRANAQLLAGIKSEQVEKDPATGQLVRVNKLTGEKQPLTAQDAAQYQATGILPQNNTGLFPSLNQPQQQTIPQSNNTGGSQQVSSQQPTFGFPLEQNLNQIKPQQAVDEKRLTAFTSNQQKAENALRDLDVLDQNIQNFKTGTGAGLGGMADKALSASGFANDETDKKATQYDTINSSTNDLVSQLQGFEPAPGQRGTLLGLQTLINSKPNVGDTTQANQNTIAKYRGEINDYLTTEQLAQAYQQANPLKVINEANVNALDDALKKKYPLTSVNKDGNTVFNADNAQKIRDAIPDAIANPSKYINAASEAQSKLPQGGSNAPSSQLNAKEQLDSITAAKQAISSGAPKDAVRQRLIDAGINPSHAGL